jgi:hypothetical protein
MLELFLVYMGYVSIVGFVLVISGRIKSELFDED